MLKLHSFDLLHMLAFCSTFVCWMNFFKCVKKMRYHFYAFENIGEDSNAVVVKLELTIPSRSGRNTDAFIWRGGVTASQSVNHTSLAAVCSDVTVHSDSQSAL